MKVLRVGYIPLVDSALLHVARAYDFAEAEGLDLDLVRETSWANIRDKLSIGLFDAAHMLAPSAMAACLGLGSAELPVVAPVALGLDGNAITLSQALYAQVMEEACAAEAAPADPYVTAKALAKVAAKRRASGAPRLTFAHVYPFSSHHYQLRLWFAAGGLDPQKDVDLVVVPPPFMVESLTQGLIDGFCVGEPWNSFAALSRAGHIVHRGRDIVRNCPEKLLAFRGDVAMADADCVAALSKSVRRAADWAADKDHIEDLAYLLSHDVGLDVPIELLCTILDPEREPGLKTAKPRLDPAATIAYPAQADWLYAQMRAAGQIGDQPAAKARAVYRPDLAGDLISEMPIDLEIKVLSAAAIA